MQANRLLAGSTDARQYLTFSLAGELFAVDTLRVREIIEYGGLTSVPMLPPSIRGVINLRGAVVPVIDLQVRFGKGPCAAGRRTCVVILEVERDGHQQVIGVIVDTVNAVLEIPAQDIEPAPAFGASVRADFILGIGKLDERLVILLDIGRVLSVDELHALAQAGTAAD